MSPSTSRRGGTPPPMGPPVGAGSQRSRAKKGAGSTGGDDHEPDNVDVVYVAEMIFQMLDSIRYARDIFNPIYVMLETSNKLRATSDLKRIARLASEFFCEETARQPGKYVDENAVKTLMETAIHHALALRRGK